VEGWRGGGVRGYIDVCAHDAMMLDRSWLYDELDTSFASHPADSYVT